MHSLCVYVLLPATPVRASFRERALRCNSFSRRFLSTSDRLHSARSAAPAAPHPARLAVVLIISALISASRSCSFCIFSDRARYASALFAVTSPPPPGVSLIVAVALVARVHALTRASSNAEIDFSRSIPRLSHSLVVVCHYLLHTVLCISPATADSRRLADATHTRFTSARFPRVDQIMTLP